MAEPDRLIADALRGQANFAPAPMGLTSSGGYGLLSGTDLPYPVPAPAATTRLEQPRRLPVGTVVLIALLLGLAVGATVGFITLI